jgi:hypothetical protein
MNIKTLRAMQDTLNIMYREAMIGRRIPPHNLLDFIMNPLRQVIDDEIERQLDEVRRFGT